MSRSLLSREGPAPRLKASRRFKDGPVSRRRFHRSFGGPRFSVLFLGVAFVSSLSGKIGLGDCVLIVELEDCVCAHVSGCGQLRLGRVERGGSGGLGD